MTMIPGEDTPLLRKARGAFFTPKPITTFMSEWAIRDASDRVLEPSAGDAEFMVAATKRLRELSRDDKPPTVNGVELHSESASMGICRVEEAGGNPSIKVGDFFLVAPDPVYDCVIGNPPYIRYQDFSGDARTRARGAALRGGVVLSGLASSWAAFVVHSALFLKQGGRLALVLPAELLSVNYASPVRSFLFENFNHVELVMFEEQVFPEAEADVVLLLADGYGQGPSDAAFFRQTKNGGSLQDLSEEAMSWVPKSPGGKWTGSLMGPVARDTLTDLIVSGTFASLETWGDTTLGIVTGKNSYFTLTPAQVEQMGLASDEVLRLSPPGSAHLRGLTMSTAKWRELGKQGRATYLFRPDGVHSPAAENYIREGLAAGVDQAYKCRVRRVWYQPPLVAPADMFLTYMNADAPRLCTNDAKVYHLNSVHGLYLNERSREAGRKLLSIAGLNSVTLLHAELVGRAYGGGLLKLEPKEADKWLMPSLEHVEGHAQELNALKPSVRRLLASGRLQEASRAVDAVLLPPAIVRASQLDQIRAARELFASRRKIRGASGR